MRSDLCQQQIDTIRKTLAEIRGELVCHVVTCPGLIDLYTESLSVESLMDALGDYVGALLRFTIHYEKWRESLHQTLNQ